MCATKFNRRDYHRFGSEIFQKRGYEVGVWDFSLWLKPEYFKNYTPPDPIEFDGYKLLENKVQIKRTLSGLSPNDIVVDPWKVITKHSFIHDILSKKGVAFGEIIAALNPQKNTIPIHKSDNVYNNKLYLSLLKKLYLLLRVFFTKLLTKRLMFTKANIVRPLPNFIICGGKKAEQLVKERSIGNNSTDIIKAHALDYDRYLEENNKMQDVDIKKNYALLLDEDQPFHPDYLWHNIEPYCDPEKYYFEINRFFKCFEQKAGMLVVIAANPRVDYQKRGNPFDSRKIVVGNTIHYVKHADTIFCHMSTAKNFAVLYNKPIVFLDSDHYSLRCRESIAGHASALGQFPINISYKIDSSFINGRIDKKLYNSYIKSYIKEPGTPEKPVWDIFCDYLDNLNI